MADIIDIGNPAINRGTALGSYTLVNKGNPANASGVINTIEIWANTSLVNCEVATFYRPDPDNFPNNLSTRDHEYIGAVTAGSKRTFSVDIDVQEGDYIGIYYSAGKLEVDSSGGSGMWYASGVDYIPCTNQAFTSNATYVLSLFGGPRCFSVYPPAQSSTYVKATTYHSSTYAPYLATDPTKSLIGSWAGTSWLTLSYVNANQRFHIDLGSAKVIRRIYYENGHSSGSYTNWGAKNFTFWGSNTAASFADLVYGNDAGWTQLTVSQNTFDIHIVADQADPKYITVTNSTAYRYYAFKFADNYGYENYMTVRRIELQIELPVFEYIGTGELTYSGEAEQSYKCDFIYLSSGNFVTSGSGICRYEKAEWEYVGSGELVYSGEATISYTFNYLYIGIGEFVYSGSAIQVHTFNYSHEGSGVFTYLGKIIYRWDDWARITKGTSDFARIEKEKDGWEEIDKV